MSQGVLLGLAVVAGLACPAHMWWSHRRGSRAACRAPGAPADGGNEIEALRARQRHLRTLIVEHEGTGAAAGDDS